MRAIPGFMLAALLTLTSRPGLADFTRLRPLAIVACDSYDKLVSSAVLGLGGIGLPEAVSAIKDQLGAMLLTPSMVGVDVRQPLSLYILAPEPPDEPPTPVALLPLTGTGQSYLAAMRGLYANMEEAGGVRVLTGPKDPSCPEPLYVAVAEGHAMAALRLEGLRWLAAQRRDRAVPAAAPLAAPLRLTLNAPNCGLLLGLIAAGSSTATDELEDDGGFTAEMARELGLFVSSFETIDVGVDADSLQFTLLLRLNTASNTPLARAIANLRPVSPEIDCLLPAERLGGGAGGLAGLLTALPADTLGWLERLADSTRLLGLQICPGSRGWLAALAPHLNGEHAIGLLPSLRGKGMVLVRSFGLNSASQAEATLARLWEHPPPGALLQGATNLPPRRHGATTIRGYRLATTAAAATRDAGLGFGQALTRLLDMGTVEMAVTSNRLTVIQGAPGDMDAWLQRPARQGPSCLESARRRASAPWPAAGATMIGGAELASFEALRAIVALLPGIAREQMAAFPPAGNGLSWRLTREGRSLVWHLQISSNEIYAWWRLRHLDPELRQTLMTQLVLTQFRDTVDAPPPRNTPATQREKVR